MAAALLADLRERLWKLTSARLDLRQQQADTPRHDAARLPIEAIGQVHPSMESADHRRRAIFRSPDQQLHRRPAALRKRNAS